jgi:KDO2-lipid IV(A) lauroyltransferase
VTRLRYALEALGAFLAYAIFAALPVDAASAVGSRIVRTVGPYTRLARVAEANLRAAFPEKPPAEIDRILSGVWDNIGRTIGEYPHLATIARGVGTAGARISVVGMEHVEALRRGGTTLMFSAHLGNWEVYAPAVYALGIPYAQVYRDPNNPFVSWLMHRVRRLPVEDMVPKGAAGARKALAVLNKGGRLGMLIDQKMNDGIAVPFFGRDAMTAPALARFALRYRCPVVPVRLERVDGARFRLTFYSPLAVADSGDSAADIAETTARANRILEGWIR